MKKLMLFALVAMMAVASFGDWGLWVTDGSFSSVTLEGTPMSLADFDGANLGEFDLTLDTFVLSAISVNIWKNGASDVNATEFFYTIYSGARPGAPVFTSLGGGWLADLGGGDQTWGATGLSVDLLAGLSAGMSYTLEIYGQIQGTDDGNPANNYFQYDNNNGAAANYSATFSTAAAAPIPEPATMSLLGLGALAMVLRRKIRK